MRTDVMLFFSEFLVCVIIIAEMAFLVLSLHCGKHGVLIVLILIHQQDSNNDKPKHLMPPIFEGCDSVSDIQEITSLNTKEQPLVRILVKLFV